MKDLGGVKSPTIRMRPWPAGTQSFICGCGRYGAFGEQGTLLHSPTEGPYAGKHLLIVQCPCGTWHAKFMELPI